MCDSTDQSSIGFNPIVLCNALVNSTEASELPIVYHQKNGQWLEVLSKWNEDRDTSAPLD